MGKEIEQAIDTLVKNLKEDKDYRRTWKANIAMSFYDEVKRRDPEGKEIRNLHETANTAAENFLTMLCFIGSK
jgi:hypothetical protein